MLIKSFSELILIKYRSGLRVVRNWLMLGRNLFKDLPITLNSLYVRLKGTLPLLLISRFTQLVLRLIFFGDANCTLAA